MGGTPNRAGEAGKCEWQAVLRRLSEETCFFAPIVTLNGTALSAYLTSTLMS